MKDLIAKANGGLFDSHCHLNDASYDEDRDQVVQDAVDAGVGIIVDVGESLESSIKALENAKRYPGKVLAAVGIDPHAFIPKDEAYYREELQQDAVMESEMEEIEQLVKDNAEYVAMIGETGIDDYWYQQMQVSGKMDAEQAEYLMKKQEQLFRHHLQLSQDTGLPLTIHSRGAEQRCLDIANEYSTTGVFHSYTGDYPTAKNVLDAGYMLGANGIVTFKNTHELRETYSKVLGKVSYDWSPQDFYDKGVVFETDGPFLSPEGKRGERNHPQNIVDIFDLLIKTLHSL